MEAKIEGEKQYLYRAVVPEMKSVGNRSLEWDLNDWKWDGDLFTAKQMNSVPSDCRGHQLFPVDPPEIPENVDDDINTGEGRRELEKRRRGVVTEGLEMNEEIGSLNLNLGGQVYPINEGEETSGKKTKMTVSCSTTSNRTVCQVEDCRADLSNAKDYHRRHKVCDLHSKASKALVGNVMQRFCQQCSRFHVLQEFDEGKRSCRRRLAGHNKRRRKTHPDAAEVNGGPPNEERGSSYLLMSLLRILSNMHLNDSDHTRNQSVLSRLLGNLASLAGTVNGRNIASLLEGYRDLVKDGTSGAAQNVPNTNANGPEPSRPFGSSIETSNGLFHQDHPEPRVQRDLVPYNDMAQKCITSRGGGSSISPLRPQSSNVLPLRFSLPSQTVGAETATGRNGLSNIDLNNAYDEVEDYAENPGNSLPPVASGVGSLHRNLWIQRDSLKSSPPQTSRNSDSTSTQSPPSSSGEAQSRTDRIVFKLFGKNPNDFPLVLRSQILSWLSHSPTEIESYIRPGCIILTVYLRLENSAWEELMYNLGSSLRKLLAESTDSFWKTGWIYTRVRHSVAFLYNGQVVLDMPLHLESQQNCQILCIKPLAVSASTSTKFIVKGFNLFLPSAKLLCALEGKYLVHDMCYDLTDDADADADAAVGNHELQHLSFSCHIPNMTGRGFIEVVDNALRSCSFPFIVAEEEICSEICKLENVIEAAETTDDVQIKTKLMDKKTRALNFIQEIGWLLHRSRLKIKLGPITPVQDRFHFNRFTWLVGFSMDHDWCAVMKKLLDIIFEGAVDTGEHNSAELALLNLGLLHRAVKRNCRPMVELLLNFVPDKASDTRDSKDKQVSKSLDRFLFRPDAVGPAGLTPLHVAASTNGSENVLDALTDDPGMVGIEAWKSAKDNSGLTPNDYASLRGYYSYIQLVQRKTTKKCDSQHVLDIPGTLVNGSMKKQPDGHRSSKVSSLHTEKIAMTTMSNQCGLCQHKQAYGGVRRALLYRPAMLSMVSIAAVCVCVALLFKSSPRVSYVFHPFTWESLEYGPI